MELEEFNLEPKPRLTAPQEPRPFVHVGTHVVYLMDPRDGSVQKRHFGPDLRLGAVEDEL